MYVENIESLDKTYIKKIRTKMRILGIDSVEVEDKYAKYSIGLHGDIQLLKCLVTDGEYTIPELVTSLHREYTTMDIKDKVFENCKRLKVRNKSALIDLDSMFAYNTLIEELDLSEFDSSKVYSMGYLFIGCTNLRKLNISNFNTSRCLIMTSMFERCHSLKELDLSSFDVSNVEEVEYMFAHNDFTRLDVRNFCFNSIYDEEKFKTIFVDNHNLLDTSKYLLPDCWNRELFYKNEPNPYIFA